MTTIHVDVEGFEAFEFDVEDRITAENIEIRIRTALRLQGGSVRQGLRAFRADRILEAGRYFFTGFVQEGKCYHVYSMPHYQ